MTLEELIRDMAARGEIVELSIYGGKGEGYAAVFAAASPAGGITRCEHADPVEALKLVLVETKVKKRSVVASTGLTVGSSLSPVQTPAETEITAAVKPKRERKQPTAPQPAPPEPEAAPEPEEEPSPLDPDNWLLK